MNPVDAVALPSHIEQSPLPRLKITEIFLSLQGEADSIGWPTVFVRLTGCPLRCTYCDTSYAFHGGQWRDIDDIVAEVLGYFKASLGNIAVYLLLILMAAEHAVSLGVISHCGEP